MHPTRNSAAFIINLLGARVMPGVMPVSSPYASSDILSYGIWPMYEPRSDEQRLLREYSEATGTKRILSWSAASAVVIGAFVLPVGRVLGELTQS